MCLTLLNDVIIIIIVVVIIIMNINIITPLFYKYWFLIELINRVLYSGSSPLDTSVHSGDTKFGRGQIFLLSFNLLPLLKGHLYSGEGDTFSGSQIPGLTSIQGTT